MEIIKNDVSKQMILKASLYEALGLVRAITNQIIEKKPTDTFILDTGSEFIIAIDSPEYGLREINQKLNGKNPNWERKPKIVAKQSSHRSKKKKVQFSPNGEPFDNFPTTKAA